MKSKVVAIAVLLLPLCCARDFPDWYYHQDRTIKMPRFDPTDKIAVIDGPTAQALHAVENDFLPAPSKRYPCYYTPKALVYKVIRSGDIIFVEVAIDLAACGDQGVMFDSSGRYAVSLDGRILRRQLDLEPGDEEPDDGGRPWTYLPSTPDGGFRLDTQPLCPQGQESYLPGKWLEKLKRFCPEQLDGGASAEQDGGAVSEQDASSAPQARDAGSTPGP